ncbi:CHC2 zinc finger domain-containing protein [Simiduia sp. 21SJ11W-1]|uniref:CHC2 zinc finger domain-containing protein n=1 Tax=Simiduia sp. 21SJ11W-1 TaxID=2909669 RepID=UPI0020A1E3F0|nr:CHC2 zinc finger domain-containing protein [Simiduia sp. 21SJ11W-1]UTA47445.1 CHC2 zinc finger domain-containing protein [Simiduia sp. 21SJ11W-1]
MPLVGILNLLKKVRPSGRNRWMACCPAHEDNSPSLSIAVGGNEKILLHCFAGCQLADITEAIGLSVSDLFPKITNDLEFSNRFKHASNLANQAELDALTLIIAKNELMAGRALSAEDQKTVTQAIDRLGNAIL